MKVYKHELLKYLQTNGFSSTDAKGRWLWSKTSSQKVFKVSIRNSYSQRRLKRAFRKNAHCFDSLSWSISFYMMLLQVQSNRELHINDKSKK